MITSSKYLMASGMYMALTAPNKEFAKRPKQPSNLKHVTDAAPKMKDYVAPLSRSDPSNLSRHPALQNLSNSNSYTDLKLVSRDISIKYPMLSRLKYLLLPHPALDILFTGASQIIKLTVFVNTVI